MCVLQCGSRNRIQKLIIHGRFGRNTSTLIMLLHEDIGSACVVHTVLVVYLAAKERTQQVIF